MIEKYQLDNGVRIVLEKIPYVRSVSIGIWVGTGSRFETPEINGISHFLEHMLFKGTKNRTAREIAETFDRIGGQVNAFTSKEYTCYYAKVLDQHIELAIDVLSDMYFNSVMDEEEIKKEKRVVIEEISMYEDTPDDLVHDLIATAAFGDHPLGYSILGTEEVLESLTRDQILQYVEHAYTPENTVIAIAGNMDSRIVKSLAKHFSSYQRVLTRVSHGAPEYRADELFRTKKELEQAHICLSLPGYPLGHEDIYSLILMNNVLGGTMSSRLFQQVREERGLAYSVFSYHSAFKDNGMLVLYAGTAPDQLDEVLDISYKVLADIRKHGITPVELNNSKEQLKGSLMLSLESTNSRMSRLGKNELLFGRHFSLDDITERIDCVSLESIALVSKEILKHPVGLSLVSPLQKIPKAFRKNVEETV